MQSLPVVALFLFAIIGLWGAGSIAGASRRGSLVPSEFDPRVCASIGCKDCKARNGVLKCVDDDGREHCNMSFQNSSIDDPSNREPFCANDGKTYS